MQKLKATELLTFTNRLTVLETRKIFFFVFAFQNRTGLFRATEIELFLFL